MVKKNLPQSNLTLEKIVGGGQALGLLENGKKAFVWGGLPGETVLAQVTKKKSNLVQAYVTEVYTASDDRIEPKDPDSYLSTSPWQIMTFAAEQHYKSALIEEAFELHDIVLPETIGVYSNEQQYGYRNKVEFSFWWDNDKDQLDLAFFRRGTHGKIPVEETSLALPTINEAALRIRDVLRARNASAYSLKTVMIRCDQSGNVVAQLYVKESNFDEFSDDELVGMALQGFELIYSNPLSPASVITERIQEYGDIVLSDTILGVPFRYATEGFFQVNLPIYEQTLRDMKQWIDETKATIDLYAGVGSIGLTIGGQNVTLVEINEHAIREMQRNISAQGRDNEAKAILAASESALDSITTNATIIVDPPRAGLHPDVIKKLLEATPSRIVYLSCNPVTQARDVALLAKKYGIKAHQGYNFFPRTPHIEHLIILDLKK